MSFKMRRPFLGLLLLAAPSLSAQVANWPLNDAAFTAPASEAMPGSVAALPMPVDALSVPEVKLREAIAQQQARVNAHPGNAAERVPLVYMLIDAGAGEQARAVAEKAVAQSHSAAAWSAEGWALEHDLIGVRFGGGFRWKEAVAAYRHAVDASPNDVNARLQLAVLEEYDANGFRYSSAASLGDAITQYRKLRTIDHTIADQYEDNLLFDLVYEHHFRELLAEIQSVGDSPLRRTLAYVAGHSQGTSDADDHMARGILENLRVRRPQQVTLLPQSDPRSIVQQLLVDQLTGRLNDEATVESMMARHAYTNQAMLYRSARRSVDAETTLMGLWKRTGVGFDLLSDGALSRIKLSATGDDAHGFRITVDGNPSQSFFIVREDSRYRIVGNARNNAEAGTEAIWLAQHGGEEAARAVLDWKREQVRRGGDGSALATLWNPGNASGAELQRHEVLAAATLLMNNSALTPLLPTLASLRDRSPANEQPAIDVLIARGYIFAGDAEHAKQWTRRLLAANPDSATLQSLAASADGMSGDIVHWSALLQAQLAKRPGDRTLLEQAAKKDETAGDFARARADLKAILDGGHAVTVDYNLYGWLALFSRPIADDAIPSSLHANEMSNQANFSALHTLACLKAVTGKPAEARSVILHGMDVNRLALPNDAVWMVMGYVYEQYGLRESAISAYRSVPRPDHPVDPTESYVLAQRRLKALGAE